MKIIKWLVIKSLVPLLELLLMIHLFPAALISRLNPNKIDIGFGPEPMINNLYYKQALMLYGYSAQTYVTHTSILTDQYDIDSSKFRYMSALPTLLREPLHRILLLYLALWRYRCLFIHFNGGILGTFSRHTSILRRVEPHLYRLAGVKVIMLPYGSDVHDLTRSRNLWFRHAMVSDYPLFHRSHQRVIEQIDRWTRHADHIINCGDQVDFLYHWDTLRHTFLCISIDDWQFAALEINDAKRPLRILHAPNHRHIKGSRFFINAVDELTAEGVPVELILLEGVPNTQVKEIMATVDLVADQLILGWHGLFAVEAMAMGKPVLCYLREDLLNLYITAGSLKPGEIPMINCNPMTVKETIRDLALNREQLVDISHRSRQYVLDHHSPEAIGAVFDQILRSLGITPDPATIQN